MSGEKVPHAGSKNRPLARRVGCGLAAIELRVRDSEITIFRHFDHAFDSSHSLACYVSDKPPSRIQRSFLLLSNLSSSPSVAWTRSTREYYHRSTTSRQGATTIMSPSTSPSGKHSPSWRLISPSELRKILGTAEPGPSTLTAPSASSSSSLPASSTYTLHLHHHPHHHVKPSGLPMHSLESDSTPTSTPVMELVQSGGSISATTNGGVLLKSADHPSSSSIGTTGIEQEGGAYIATTRSENSRTLCVRHQSMADQGINGKLQQVSHTIFTYLKLETRHGKTVSHKLTHPAHSHSPSTLFPYLSVRPSPPSGQHSPPHLN
jgi:hypothetical protein